MQDSTDRPTGFPAPAPQVSPSGGTSSTTGTTDQVKTVIGQAADRASTLMDQVKDKATSAVEGQKAGLADQLDSLADAVHKSGQQFSGQQDWIAGAIERGAAELTTLATSLRENDVTALFAQVRSIRPAAAGGVHRRRLCRWLSRSPASARSLLPTCRATICRRSRRSVMDRVDPRGDA